MFFLKLWGGRCKPLGCVGAFCGWQGLFKFCLCTLGTILILQILLIKHFGKLGSKNGSFEIDGEEIPLVFPQLLEYFYCLCLRLC